MKVELLAYTPDADKLVAAAAKLCYAKSDIDTLLEGLTPEKTEAFLDKLMSLGHESPVEHASFTFGIEGVSRTLLAQLTRHRIASFSALSTAGRISLMCPKDGRPLMPMSIFASVV